MQRRAKSRVKKMVVHLRFFSCKCVETIDLQPKLEIEREDKSAEETACVKIKLISGH